MELDHKKATHAFYRLILQWVIPANEKAGRQPFFIGLNAPQGAGKTTLTRWLREQLAELNLVAITISINDFYLTREIPNTLPSFFAPLRLGGRKISCLSCISMSNFYWKS